MKATQLQASAKPEVILLLFSVVVVAIIVVGTFYALMTTRNNSNSITNNLFVSFFCTARRSLFLTAALPLDSQPEYDKSSPFKNTEMMCCDSASRLRCDCGKPAAWLLSQFGGVTFCHLVGAKDHTIKCGQSSQGGGCQHSHPPN